MLGEHPEALRTELPGVGAGWLVWASPYREPWPEQGMGGQARLGPHWQGLLRHCEMWRSAVTWGTPAAQGPGSSR
jgi:hypothetical protein